MGIISLLILVKWSGHGKRNVRELSRRRSSTSSSLCIADQIPSFVSRKNRVVMQCKFEVRLGDEGATAALDRGRFQYPYWHSQDWHLRVREWVRPDLSLKSSPQILFNFEGCSSSRSCILKIVKHSTKGCSSALSFEKFNFLTRFFFQEIFGFTTTNHKLMATFWGSSKRLLWLLCNENGQCPFSLTSFTHFISRSLGH